jgi:transposase
LPAKNTALNSKMRQAATLLGQGHSVKEVAELVGKPEDTILNWKRKPAFQAACEEECNKWLSELKPQALLFLKSLLEADDKRLGANAATTLLRYAAQLGSAGEGHIVVNFTGGMPEPGMPKKEVPPEDKDEDGE